MIVPMKRLTLLCLAAGAERTLEALRELKCAHLDVVNAASAETNAAQDDLAAAEEAVRVLAKAAADYKAAKRGSSSANFDALRSAHGLSVAAILKAAEERRVRADAAEKLARTIAFYAPYGDFDPALARDLLARGIDLGRVAEWPDPLPTERLSEMQRRHAEMLAENEALLAALAAAHGEVGTLVASRPGLEDRLAFAAARDQLGAEGQIAWIQGWIPQDAVPSVRARAVKEGWGILFRDPAEGENPPTLVRPPKMFRPVVALFEGLGIAPAYTEADVSVPFLCYFALFFAMLVGDGGYGAIILALTLWLWRRTKPAEGHRPRILRSWLTLGTVFSLCTIAWGLASNTWFGAAIPACADWPTVRWLGGAGAGAGHEYDNMMLLCFTIAVSHLMLARLWNAACRFGSWDAVSELGWAGVVLFMYILTNSIVGIFAGIPTWAYYVFGVSFLALFIRAKGMDKGMLFLNTMSVLGDIISYVRLFAVGLASVKVAQNFNDMALNLNLPWYVKAVPLVLILLIGHGLNFAMAGLSILVHAVRLNTLEFSNHKGVSWAGYAFRPFARTAK